MDSIYVVLKENEETEQYEAIAAYEKFENADDYLQEIKEISPSQSAEIQRVPIRG